MTAQWSIDELTAIVEKALGAGDYNGQESGRVRAVPDARTIRYYTTLGLIDPPAEMRGRKAYYSRRHVLQLAAIKRLQAQGYTLPQVQQSLVGADERTLTRWAGLPAKFWQAAETAAKQATTAARTAAPFESKARRQPFWSQSVPTSSSERGAAPAMRAAIHLPVSKGVELVIQDAAALDADTLARLAPLFSQLAAILSKERIDGKPGAT